MARPITDHTKNQILVNEESHKTEKDESTKSKEPKKHQDIGAKQSKKPDRPILT